MQVAPIDRVSIASLSHVPGRPTQETSQFVAGAKEWLAALPEADHSEVVKGMSKRHSFEKKFESDFNFFSAVVESMAKASKEDKVKGIARRPSWAAKFESPLETDPIGEVSPAA